MDGRASAWRTAPPSRQPGQPRRRRSWRRPPLGPRMPRPLWWRHCVSRGKADVGGDRGALSYFFDGLRPGLRSSGGAFGSPALRALHAAIPSRALFRSAIVAASAPSSFSLPFFFCEGAMKAWEPRLQRGSRDPAAPQSGSAGRQRCGIGIGRGCGGDGRWRPKGQRGRRGAPSRAPCRHPCPSSQRVRTASGPG